MSDQTLDLRRSLQLVRRHKILVATFAALGLAAGVGFTLLTPAMLSSDALVVLPVTVRNMATQVVIASSDPVLAGALRTIDSAESPQTLRNSIQVKGLTSNILSVSAQGKTAAQAEQTANAIADSYVGYVNAGTRSGVRVQARVLERATNASGTSLSIRLIITGGLGALAGLLIGAIVAIALGRRDRRLQVRDEIADSIGVPVLMSIAVSHPSDAAGWTKLFEDYEPGSVDAWRLRKALRQLGPASTNLTDPPAGSFSLAVLSLSSDPKALALGPQLAVFAATLGIPTVLVVGPQQDANSVATLRAACTARPESARRSTNLRVTVSDEREIPDRVPGAGLIVVVAVVSGEAPQVADTMRTTATVLGVSAGVATAEQLARVAVSAATDGRDISGILVADPDSADHTTGRLPELARPAQNRRPTRITGVPMGTRR
jgi:capsular polysaccharide biosynthesis protein